MTFFYNVGVSNKNGDKLCVFAEMLNKHRGAATPDHLFGEVTKKNNILLCKKLFNNVTFTFFLYSASRSWSGVIFFFTFMKTTAYQKQLCDNEETVNLLDWNEEESEHLTNLLNELLNVIKRHKYDII